jgi:hypothetical protein
MKTPMFSSRVWMLVAFSSAGCGGALSGSTKDAAIDADSSNAQAPDASASDASAPPALTPDASAADAFTAAEASATDGAFLTFGGTFGALPLHPLDGMGHISRLVSGPPAAAGVRSTFAAVVSDRTNLCAISLLRPNETAFAISALSGDDPFRPSTFAVGGNGVPGEVNVSVTRMGPVCTPTDQYASASGSVVITRVTSDAVAGTFDVTLPGDAGTLQGSFDVPLCGQPSARCTP